MKIVILSTGGTISAIAPDLANLNDYKVGRVEIKSLLSPKMRRLARIKKFSNIDSADMTNKMLFNLARRVEKLASCTRAVVITHGTDSMAESAYFLSLTIRTKKPIILTGAMKPTNALDFDGARNLGDAILVARKFSESRESSAIRGVFVVMGGLILSANEVYKAHTSDLCAFQSIYNAPFGRIENGKIEILREARLNSCANLNLCANRDSCANRIPKFRLKNIKKLPRVDILWVFEGAKIALKAYLKVGSEGLIIVGCGNGSIHKAVRESLKKCKIPFVVCSNINLGAVEGKFGISGGILSPQKARIALMLTLSHTKNATKIAKIMREIAQDSHESL